MGVTIRGKTLTISSEEARAWIQATLCVLAYHNKPLKRNISISFVSRLPVDGRWYVDGRIQVRNWIDPQATFTAIVHELIHECVGEFGDETDDTNEKCTSTLTARLKPEIAALAALLLEGTYRRAAWFAHTKLSYKTKPEEEDYYDPAQNKHIPWQKKYRRKKR